jgi:putative ABC transport system permease protein
VRRALVTAEVVLAMVLMVGAGLLARTYVGLMDVDLGVRPEGVLTFHLAFPPTTYPTPGARSAFVDEFLVRLRADDRVQAVGAASSMPLRSWLSQTASVEIDGHPVDDQSPPVSMNPVSDGFFEAAGASVLCGQVFRPQQAGASEAVVGRSLVRRFWPHASASGAEALGRTLRMGTRTYEIIGVVNDVKYAGPDGKTEEVLYVPFASSPTDVVSMIVRTTGDPMALVPAARSAVVALDANMAIDSAASLEQVVATSVAPPRFRLAIIGAFAALALVLAMIGLYGVMAQSVAQRTQEIGIRLALGAGPARIMRMVLREALLLVGPGVAVGVAVSVAATRVLSSFLFGVTPTDAPTYAGVAIALRDE